LKETGDASKEKKGGKKGRFNGGKTKRHNRSRTAGKTSNTITANKYFQQSAAETTIPQTWSLRQREDQTRKKLQRPENQTKDKQTRE
jgi:hypothetical protein